MARALPAPRRGAAPLCAPPTPPPPRRGRAAARACPAAPPRAPARRHRPAAAAPPPPRRGRATARAGPSFASSDSDVVVVGAGVGGLSCAALLAMHGLDVTVAEAHTVVGGAAHAYSRRGFHFESGPSLYAGMAARGAGANPLAHVLQAIEEPLELVEYAEWQVFCPEVPGGIVTTTGARGFDELLTRAAGPEALRQWRAFQAHVEPLSRAATALPPAAIRLDAGVVRSAARFLPALARAAPRLGQLTGPFSNVMDAGGLTDLFARNWCDLLCWLLSGLDSRGTIAAEVAFMFAEWYRPASRLEFPVGGSQALADALARGVTKRGGRVLTGARAERVLMADRGGGRRAAAGVRLAGGAELRARRAIVSNAGGADALRLLAPADAPPAFAAAVAATPLNESFMHLHLGFDAAGLEGLGMHHIVIDSWDVTAPQNVVLISIASVADPALAPAGKHVLHAYTPATEPWALWEGLDRDGEEYEALKEERAAVLWRAVERVVPGIRARVEVAAVGTPLTQARFVNRHRGSYGPAHCAGEAVFPFGNSAGVEGFYCVGDFAFPGIGLPAVAASGMVVASSLVPVGDHLRFLDRLGL